MRNVTPGLKGLKTTTQGSGKLPGPSVSLSATSFRRSNYVEKLFPIEEALGSGVLGRLSALLNWIFTNGIPTEFYNYHERAGGATEVNSDGLIDYADEQLFNFSDLDLGQWFGTGCVLSDSAEAPPASVSDHPVKLLTVDSAGGTINASVYDAPGTFPVTGEPIVLSVWVKGVVGGLDFFRVAGFGVSVIANLTTGVVDTDIGVSQASETRFEGEADEDGFRWMKLVVRKDYAGSGTLYIGGANVTRDGSPMFLVAAPHCRRGYEETESTLTSGDEYFAPRLTHDPVTLEPLGYLHEPQATNLNNYFDLANGYTDDSGRIILELGAAESPSGQVDAARIEDPDGSTNRHITVKTITGIVSGTEYTYSAYFKKDEVNFAQLWISTAFPSTYANFDLDSGVVGTTNATTSKIESVGNGWYRCSLTVTAIVTTNATSALAFVPAANSVALGSGTFGAGQGLFVWGAQLEEGSVATSLIPTYGAATIRQADTFNAPVSIPAGQWTLIFASIPLRDPTSLEYQLNAAGPGSSPNLNLTRIQSGTFRIGEGTDGTAVDVTQALGAGYTPGDPHYVGASVDTDGALALALDGSTILDAATTMVEAPELTSLKFDDGTYVVPQIVKSIRFTGQFSDATALKTLTRYVPITNMAAMGDSLTSGALLSGTTWYDDGYPGFALDSLKHSLEHVFYAPDGTYHQTGGFSAQQIIDTWLPRVIADAPDMCVIYAGANSLDDARGISADLDVAAEWIADQVWELVDGCVSNGINVIVCTLTPDIFPTDTNYPPAANTYHPDYRTIRKKLNDIIRAEAASHDAVLCDWAYEISTSATDDTALADPDWLADNIHPNIPGRMKLGVFLADVIRQNFILPDEFAVPADGDPAWLTSNPYLSGDSGGLATGWSLFGSPTSKIPSKPSANVQRVSTYSAFGALKNANFTQYVQETDQSLDGLTIRPIVKLTFPDTSKMPAQIELYVLSSDIDGAGGSQASQVMRMGGSGNANALTRDMDPDTGELLMLGPEITTVSTTGTDRHRITLQVNIYGGDDEGIVDLETCGVIVT